MNATSTHTHTHQRLFYPDFLRVIAIFAVIMIHVAASQWGKFGINSFEWQVFNFYDGLSRWCVPVFVMVSGMFLLDFRRYSDDVGQNFKKILSKNLVRILIALVFWSIFYTYYQMFLNNKFDPNPARIFDFLFRATRYHLWFLYLIAGLYLLAPFLQVLVKNLSKKDFELLLIVLAIFCCGYDFINVFLKTFLGKTLYFRHNLPEFSGFLLYFLAGYYFAHFEISNKSKKIFYVLFAIFLLITITLNSAFAVNFGKKNLFFAYRLINTMFVAFGIFILVKDIFSKAQISEKFRKFISLLSSLSFGAYLVHVAVLDTLIKKAHITTTTLNPLIMIPLMTMSVFIISSFLAWVISKIPLLKKVVF